jgi:hypothetical protein
LAHNQIYRRSGDSSKKSLSPIRNFETELVADLGQFVAGRLLKGGSFREHRDEEYKDLRS